jgi:hypothetical protein
MPIVRIPEEHRGKVWRALVASGPISRLSQEPVYAVSDTQVKLLRRQKLPFEEFDQLEIPITEALLRIH